MVVQQKQSAKSAPECEGPANRIRRLPSPPSTFIGRANELSVIDQLLEEARLLTLIGSGGCGKTRLAIQVARQEKFQGSEICFVDLTQSASVEQVAEVLHKALAVHVVSDGPSYDRIAAAISGRDLLLVLDNCEHVLEPIAQAAWVLLNACPDLRILATSRQPLDVNGEVTYRVPSLSTPQHRNVGMSQLMQFDAVKLFIARAASIDHSFDVDNTTAPAIAEICSRLDGIPLAIELAAARVRAMTPLEICERLHDTFKLLGGTARSAIARHQTLRATIEWSYQLLPQEERILLRRLSVFQGRFTLAAIEAVCGIAPLDEVSVMDWTENLVDKSLVATETLAGRTRYRLLETVREYASYLFATDPDKERIEQAHAETYCSLAVSMGSKLRSPDQAHGFEEAEADQRNFSKAIAFSLRSGQFDLAHQAIYGLWRAWYTRGWYDEGISLSERCLESLPKTEILKRSQLARILSLLHVSAGRDAVATEYATLNVVLREELANEFDIAEALVNRAVVFVRMERFEDAKTDANVCQPTLERFGETRAHWANLNTLGIVARVENRNTDAINLFERSRLGWESVGDYRGVGRALDGRLACETAIGDLESARRTAAELCEVWEDLEHAQGTLTLLARCVLLAQQLGCPTLAYRIKCSAERYSREKGIPLSEEDERLITSACSDPVTTNDQSFVSIDVDDSESTPYDLIRSAMNSLTVELSEI